MKYQQDQGGINSLGGFAFQILVFCSFLLELKKDEHIEFEAIEDISVSNFKASSIDDFELSCCSQIMQENIGNHAIQVKRTDITNIVAKRVILNWIWLYISGVSVYRFTLFTNDKDVNLNIFQQLNAKEIFESIKISKKKSTSLEARLKNFFVRDYNKFEEAYIFVIQNANVISEESIETLIDKKGEEVFRKSAVDITTYNLRRNELITAITMNIIENIQKGKSYKIDYSKYIQLIEDICSRVNDEEYELHYSDFKRANTININDLTISKSREYEQLKTCGLPDNMLKIFLTNSTYYESYRFYNMERNSISKIEDIEENAFENFEWSKNILQQKNEDTPFKRLDKTTSAENSYAINKQYRVGSCIFLTKADIGANQISWKDT